MLYTLTLMAVAAVGFTTALGACLVIAVDLIRGDR